MSFFLPLIWKPLFGKDCFYLSQTNEEAFKWINQTLWPFNNLCVYGPKGCGKTHLGIIWADQRNAIFIDAKSLPVISPDKAYIFDTIDAMSIDEKKLLTFLNELTEHNASCLWLARTPPSQWGFVLPDLVSRIRPMMSVAILSPDNQLIMNVIKKSFKDLGLKPSQRMLQFLINRIPRSFADIAKVISLIQEQQEKKVFTFEILKKIIEQIDQS